MSNLVWHRTRTQRWDLMPQALTELFGDTGNRIYADLSETTTLELQVNVLEASASPNTPALAVRYSTDGGVTWEYLDHVSGPFCSLAATGLIAHSVTINSLARRRVMLSVWGRGGNGVISPKIGAIWGVIPSVTPAGVWSYATRTLTAIAAGAYTRPIWDPGTGRITLVKGDAYKSTRSRTVTFSRTTWPNLTAATEVRMTVRSNVEGSIDEAIFTVTDASALRVVGVGSQSVSFELADTDTDDLTAGALTALYDVQATFADGPVTLEVSDIPAGIGGVDVYDHQTRPA